MVLPGFHPLVADWFTGTLGAPTAAQTRGWQAIRDGRHTLIAAPTGSGKTLAAFLTAIDDLVQEAVRQPLPDEVRVIYVSPLKALSADIHKNLAEPRRAIRALAGTRGLEAPRLTAAVRTGDTTASERAAMLRTPPHILVTTPESLYLLLTSARSRELLRTVRTVIVDEIHAVIGTRRGAHLALSLERLERLATRPPLRIGLSATQKPIAAVAAYLVGADSTRGGCAIVDEGHARAIDLAVEIPRSPLGAVMAHEVWEEYYDRLVELIAAHKTTLIFVNTRRLAERLARELTERLGEDAVTAHHGSLSKETRLDAEHRLKTGALKALVATASLELGIDIGHVDLVCQIGSPHRIATLLQRVGRSGHTIGGLPKGRLLPVSRDDLVECGALLRAVRRRELDAIVQHDAPLDVLAQQVAAEACCDEAAEDELFALVRRAQPYRELTRTDFDAVVGMLADGVSTRRGRRAALLHRDEVHRVLRGRRGTRLLALTSGGAIPEVADYRVVLEPDDTFIGTLNEDFAIESMAGDVFQLGNASWRVVQVAAGTVRVVDAQGAPPSIPFWFGEAPARSDELSRAVSDLRTDAERVLETEAGLETETGRVAGGATTGAGASVAACVAAAVRWLQDETGLCPGSAEQIASYLDDGRRALGTVPTQKTLVLERFFDESGGMQLVLHAPFGSRVNRAWALALRKRFCRQFNFELQAAATEDALLLSLGPQHSFPLADVFRYLHPASVGDILVQAFLDAPVFQTRWRWNATISLAVPRHRGGRKVPPQLQRMQADDLMAAVFPDAAACLENIPGDREIPDHPLVNQTVRDCLEEAMDLPALIAVLERIHRGELRCVSRDTPEPSVFADDILNARPYAFLDDAPLEERRTQAVQTRRASDRSGDAARVLDADAIGRVRDEARPDPRDADELHDALLTAGVLSEEVAEASMFAALARAGRATCAYVGAGFSRPAHGTQDGAAYIVHDGPAKAGPYVPQATSLWVAAERLPELLAVHPNATLEPSIAAPPLRLARSWTRETALIELLGGYLTTTGPLTAADIGERLGVGVSDIDAALLALEAEGLVLRGRFSSGVSDLEWCDRRLLARIHRYTLNRLRAEIAPVTAAEFMRFLFAWQHVTPATTLAGADGLRAVIAQLDGLELPARTWERDVLPARVTGYDAALLDMLCLTGEVGWARLSSGPTQVVGATPVALFLREHADAWLSLGSVAGGITAVATEPREPVEVDAERVLERLRAIGASFAADLASACALDEERLNAAIGALVAAGLVTSDGFAGLRAIVGSAAHQRPASAGRWSLLVRPVRPACGPHEPALVGRVASRRDLGEGGLRLANDPAGPGEGPARERAVAMVAWALLRRYGVVFRRLTTRETDAVPWRDLARVYRRLEARGEIRGGRFVTGMSGEQFALPDAVEQLRDVRRSAPDGRCITIGGADPLNLTGIVTHDERVRAATGTRIVYRNGVAVAAMEGDMLRALVVLEPALAAEAAAAAAGRRVPVVSGFVGRLGSAGARQR